MNVAIMSIGDELMNGFTIDTNSSYIARQLVEFDSLEVVSKITSNDNQNDIISNIDYLISKEYEYIFITGGLGPTHDDITKKALSKYFDCKLIINEPYYRRLQAFFNKIKIKKDNHLESQAQILEISKPIPNRYGTALGMVVEYKNSTLFILPGVPKEIKGMITKEIIPSYIEPNFKKIFKSITILTTGIYESKLHDILKEEIKKYCDRCKVSFLPSYIGVKIRLLLLNKDENLEQIKNEFVKKIDKYIFGYNNDKIEDVVFNQLFNKKKTIAIAESCTGGYISKKITDKSGSSKVYKGSIIAYSNSIKESFLNVPKDILKDKGAVSEEVAIIMAENIKNKFNADIGISTTGISGPTGGNEDKPVGLIFIAIAMKNKTIVKKFDLIPRRKEHREVAVHTALNMLRLLLK